MQGLLAKKLGMTQVNDGAGNRIPVTVLAVGPCVVTQRKTKAVDGYDAVQLGFGDQAERRVSKARAGQCKKAGVTPKRHLREFKLDAGEDPNLGDAITASIFADVGYVDVTGTTKGRGFQGVVKRHDMAGGRMTHGGHSKRRVGSIGQCSFPARVAKNQRMPGHMGNVRVTQQNLKVVRTDEARNLLLIHGAVPGPTGCLLEVRKALKKSAKQS